MKIRDKAWYFICSHHLVVSVTIVTNVGRYPWPGQHWDVYSLILGFVALKLIHNMFSGVRRMLEFPLRSQSAAFNWVVFFFNHSTSLISFTTVCASSFTVSEAFDCRLKSKGICRNFLVFLPLKPGCVESFISSMLWKASQTLLDIRWDSFCSVLVFFSWSFLCLCHHQH